MKRPHISSWTIGSNPQCDIVVSAPCVAEQHCRISYAQGRWQIEDLQSSTGTWVEGLRIDSPHNVLRGMEVRLGAETPLDWSRLPNPAPQVTIGRSPDNDIVLNDPEVAEYHARIRCTPGGLILQDLDSPAGTFVGRSRERVQSRPLALSERVQFGSTCSTVNQLLSQAAVNNPAVANWMSRNPMTAPPTWVSGRKFLIVAALAAFTIFGFVVVKYFPGWENGSDADTADSAIEAPAEGLQTAPARPTAN